LSKVLGGALLAPFWDYWTLWELQSQNQNQRKQMKMKEEIQVKEHDISEDANRKVTIM